MNWLRFARTVYIGLSNCSAFFTSLRTSSLVVLCNKKISHYSCIVLNNVILKTSICL